MITVYTQPNCVQCDGTKIFLDKHNLEYTHVDITADKEAYDKKANELAQLFVKNFTKYADRANDEIRSAAPVVMVGA